MIRTIFIDENGFLRSGWRAAIYLSAFSLLAVIIGSLVPSFLVTMGMMSLGASLLVNSGVSLLIALLVGWACLSLLEGLPFKALGASFSSNWFPHWLYGLVVGALTLIVPLAVAWGIGGLSFQADAASGYSIVASMSTSLVIFGVAAAFEEVLFRGYILQTFARSGLAWLAIVLTSGFFGAVHLGNPNVSTTAAVNTVLAGIWFSLAYLRTRDLWFVWGIHLIWNWLQGAVFGIEVSGLKEIVGTPLLKEIDIGPVWLTGGDYGIEGSIVTTIAIVISIAALFMLPALNADPTMLALTERRGSVEINPTGS